MCTEYTDLNKACPRDSYPLLSINRFVNEAADHNILSFLDAYSRYNQIQMHPRDIEKTAFMTDYNNFYYEVMSFSLKNAGAIYQRLMDYMFKGMLGRNFEVYVNNIVVKSDSCQQRIKDLQEVFQAIRDHGMRLNLNKCAFGLKEESFWVCSLTVA